LRAAAIIRGETQSTWSETDTANYYKIIEKLTGQLRYTDDLNFPDMLVAKAFRAQIPHGIVKKVDIALAQEMPGIVKIITAQDIPGENRFGLMIPDQEVFCEDVVRYVGDALALVVGEREDQVDEALKAIHVEIEPLPVVSSISDALMKDAPVLHPRLKAVNPELPNVLKHLHICKGDPENGFKEADFVYEQTYHVHFVEHAYMETETSIGRRDEDGLLTVYVGSQGPTNDRTQVACVLGLDESRVRIAHQYMGGGFGGKEDVAGQIQAALAAQLTGKPVKVHWSRRESILASYKRHAAEMHYKMGITKSGKLVAADVKIYSDTGAYASVGEEVLFRMMAFACGPYEIPNVEVHAYAVHTNNNPCGAFRGYGSPQVAFAAEVHLQHIINFLGLDPIEVRLMNALDINKATITGDVLTEDVGGGIVACLDALKSALKRTPMPSVEENEKLGIGIACGYKNVGLGANIPDRAGAYVSLEKNGKILVRHGATDMGQGSEQVVAEITSRVLGIPLAEIRVHTGDTQEDPPGGMTTASRATFITGNAVLLAAQGLRKVLWDWVSKEYQVPQDELTIAGQDFINQRTGKSIVSLKDIGAKHPPLIFESEYEAPKTQAPYESIAAYPDVPEAPMHFAYDFGAQAAIVSVNVETGMVKVHKIIAAHDCGEPIIYQNVVGQIEGAVIQGMGYALSEEYKIDQGIPQSTRLRDLGLLRCHQIPEIIPIVVRDPHPKGPFGAKGVGELALTPTAPAIINAIHDAVGVWVNALPATKERILQVLNER
ncbi:MAG: xanthine dehydrogenase family protein molybdopterin-binding subunit, partial [Anaerolineales bacterium]